MVQVDPALGINAALVSTEAEGHVMRIGPYQQLTAMLHEIQHWIQNFEGFARGGRPTVHAAQSSPEYKAWLKASRALPMSPTARDVETVMSLYDRIPSTVQAYRRLAGEVEARNTQKRLPMTQAQRQAAPPQSTADTPGGNQILLLQTAAACQVQDPGLADETIFLSDSPENIQ